MISLKRYLDSKSQSADPSAAQTAAALPSAPAPQSRLETLPQPSSPARPPQIPALQLESYRKLLEQVTQAGSKACPAVAAALEKSLGRIAENMAHGRLRSLEEIEERVLESLEEWGALAAEHYRQKALEVKELLLMMTRTAEAVGERDRRSADQLLAVRTRLEEVADLEDITEIRHTIERSTHEMKVSIERMTEEGRTAIEQLRQQVMSYEARLEAAERQAWQDAVTGVRNRKWIEARLNERIEAGVAFSVALIDLDGFKGVNDTLGHVAGDDLLRQFAQRIESNCREGCLLGRWGGDEFLILLDMPECDARREIEQLRAIACSEYKLDRAVGRTKLQLKASFGVAEWLAGESSRQLLERVDQAMYREKNSPDRRPGFAKPRA